MSRSQLKLQVFFLLLAGSVICLLNLWVAAQRSTIPIELKGQEVVRRQIGTEKSPGVDDVYLLWLQNGSVLRVDRTVFEEVQAGSSMDKLAWSHELTVGFRSPEAVQQTRSRRVDLQWSNDLKGLALVSAVALIASCVLAKSSIYTALKN